MSRRGGQQRSKVERAQQIAEAVHRRYLRGETQGEIADALDISQQQVSEDLAQFNRQLLAQARTDVERHRAEETARLYEVEREAWQAWERSKTERETSTTEQVQTTFGTQPTTPHSTPHSTPHPPHSNGNGHSDNGGPPAQSNGANSKLPRLKVKANYRKEEQYGDPRFLQVIRECSDQRAKLWGLYAPQSMHIGGIPGQPLQMQHLHHHRIEADPEGRSLADRIHAVLEAATPEQRARIISDYEQLMDLYGRVARHLLAPAHAKLPEGRDVR